MLCSCLALVLCFDIGADQVWVRRMYRNNNLAPGCAVVQDTLAEIWQLAKQQLLPGGGKSPC